MNISRRPVIVVFFLLIILFVGMFFWSFVLNEIITPISLAVWILLRVFVLSIDQKYYWGAIIFITSIFLYYHFLPPHQPTVQSEDFQNSNEIMRTIGYWRSLFTLTNRDKTLKKELARLLLSRHATKQRTLPYFRLYDALQQGEIPIPDQIHAFLFLEEPQEVGRSFKKLVQSIRNTPRTWIRRWTGQESAEYYRMIDEVFCFIETSLEMENDDGKFNPNKY
jgi:hypothetical protein